FLIGFLFGLPALRLEGHYLALATFALAVAVPQILKCRGLEDWTGGAQGTSLSKPSGILGLSADQWIYLFVLGIACLLFWVARNLTRGRIGRALISIRDNPVAASTMGVNVARYKSLTFAISALYTGVAGALNAIAVQYVAPDTFNLFL